MSNNSHVPALAEAVDAFAADVRRILLEAVREAVAALPDPSIPLTIDTARARALGVGTKTFNSIVRERVAAGDRRFANPRGRVFLATPEGLSEALAARSAPQAVTVKGGA